MKVSAPCTGPESKSISGQCTAIFGRPGRRLERDLLDAGLSVAAVSETESPSQLSPALIQRIWMGASSVSAACGEVAVEVLDVFASVMGCLLGRGAADARQRRFLPGYRAPRRDALVNAATGVMGLPPAGARGAGTAAGLGARGRAAAGGTQGRGAAGRGRE